MTQASNSTIKDIFFFYPIDDGANLLKKVLATKTVMVEGKPTLKARYPGIREMALSEIRDLELILGNNYLTVGYSRATHDFIIRMRRLNKNYKQHLITDESRRSYYDYLVREVVFMVRDL